jgi:hypothetical protein
MVLFTITASKIAFNLRVKYVDMVLREDVSTIDAINADSSSGVGVAINNITKVELCLGEQFGMALQLISVMVSAFIISVIRYGIR